MQTLSAVAAEYTHAVLNVVSAEGIPQQDGHVQQSGQLQHEAVPDDSSAADNVATDGDRRSQATLGRTICARDKCGTCSGPPAARGTRRLDEAAVSAEAAKIASGAIFAATILGTAVLIAEFAKKFHDDPSSRRFQHNVESICNVVLGCLCLSLLSANLVFYGWHVMHAKKQHKRWKPRRKRNAILIVLEASVQVVNLIFYIAPNIYLLAQPCYFVGPFVVCSGWLRWMCWTTLFTLWLLHALGSLRWKQPQRIPSAAPSPAADAASQAPASGAQLYMDGPWYFFWPCGLIWSGLVAYLTWCWVNGVTGSKRQYLLRVAQSCLQGGILPECAVVKVIQTAIYVYLSVALLIFVITLGVLHYKLRVFHGMVYSEVQVGLVFYRLQVRLRGVVMAFVGLYMICFYVVGVSSCVSYQTTWLGIMPMQIVMTANAFVWTFIATPYVPQDHALAVRVWDQEVAWTEADKPVKLSARAVPAQLQRKPAKRNGNRNPDSSMKRPNSPLDSKPDPAPAPTQPQNPHQRVTLNLSTALGLYKLTDSELFWETKLDTQCLLGWNDHTIVVAFRGTASMKNALSDVQMWRVAHPPARGSKLLGRRPLVHVGFMKSWLAGGFNTKVVNHVLQIVNRQPVSAGIQTIHITGHSLGGALATLAAYDIRKQLIKAGRSSVEVCCYTFGAPRTGNHAFARDYNAVVPDTWSIINSQDVVTRGAKFFVSYKRPGKRIIVNDSGRMMVSPTSIEASIQQKRAGQSVDHHFLGSYHHSILAVVLAQFSSRALPGGTQGILRLVQACPYLQGFFDSHMGMSLKAMQQFAQHGLTGSSAVLMGAHLPKKGVFWAESSSPSKHRTQEDSDQPARSGLRSLFASVMGQSKSESATALSQNTASVDTDFKLQEPDHLV